MLLQAPYLYAHTLHIHAVGGSDVRETRVHFQCGLIDGLFSVFPCARREWQNEMSPNVIFFFECNCLYSVEWQSSLNVVLMHYDDTNTMLKNYVSKVQFTIKMHCYSTDTIQTILPQFDF